MPNEPRERAREIARRVLGQCRLGAGTSSEEILADALQSEYERGKREAAERCAEIAASYRTNSGLAVRLTIRAVFGLKGGTNG
jgi:hypothetical protein